MTTPMPIPDSGGAPQTGDVNWKTLMDQSSGAAEPLPVGDYDVKVVKVDLKKTGGGKHMYALTLNVIAGPHAGRKLWTNMTISPESPGALGIFFAQMGAMGLNAEYFKQQPTVEQVGDALLNRFARVSTKQKTYLGLPRNEVTAIKQAVIMQDTAITGGFPAPAVQQPAPFAQAPQPQPVPPPQPTSPEPPSEPQPQPQPVIPQPVPQPVPPAPTEQAAPAPQAPPVPQPAVPSSPPAPAAPEAPQPLPPQPQAAPAPQAPAPPFPVPF